MSRRRLVAIASASVILGLGLLIVAVVLATTQTGFGRERVRRLVSARLAAALHGRGSMYLGHLSGNMFTGLVIDSVAIRDDEDSLVMASGPVRVKYDPRDLIDKRLLLSYVELDRPVFNLRRHADHAWNFQRIFPPHAAAASTRVPGVARAREAERQFGDFIVFDSTVIHDGTFVLTEPWSAPDSLTGARRDSADREALASTEHEIRRTREGLKQTRRWTHLELRSPYVRLADPDSTGRLVQVGRMDVDLDDPPFRARNLRGPVRILGDSVWLDVRHFDLPGSTGTAQGKVWWGSDLPTRYDVHVVGDSVSMADVAWVYPTLPTTGGGRMELTIRNDPRDLHVLEYAIRKMDVRTARSHVTGAMTFGVGGRVLALTDVALTADPLDFDLLRVLNGKPFPVDWQGQFTGTVQGKGGPLNRWQLDEAHLSFRDAHVPGAVSELSARGGLDILTPSLATFRGLDVDIARLDLRTPGALFPSFPRLRGTISGTARLDSVWTDVRFSDADLTHHDGPGATSHFTGRGRVTYGEQFVGFDVDLDASPIAFTTVARSYPALPLRGPYAGPLRAAGTMAGFDLSTALSGAGGDFSVDGHFDLAAPLFAARGTLRTHAVDLRTLLDRPAITSTRLTGVITGDVHGDSLADLEGTASIALDSSRVDSTAVGSSVAALTFGGGRLRMDSVRVATDAFRLTAAGALGLTAARSDTVRYTLAVDSLGGLRAYLLPGTSPGTSAGTGAGTGAPGAGALHLAAAGSATSVTAGAGAAGAPPVAPDPPRTPLADSLAGTIGATGVVVGSIDTVRVEGALTGDGLFLAGARARSIRGDYALRGLPRAPAGLVRLEIDSAQADGVRLASASAALLVRDSSSGLFAASVASDDAHGRFTGGAAAAITRTPAGWAAVVDSAGLAFADHVWSLASPAHIAVDSDGVAVDSMVLRSGAGVLALRGTLPTHAPADLTLTADSLALSDVGALAQTPSPLDGSTTLALHVAGMRDQPVIQLTGRFTGMKYGDLHLPYFTVHGDYASRRLVAGLDAFRGGRTILSVNGTLPVDLALEPVGRRLLPDSLHGRIEADSVDLAIVQAMSPQFTEVNGTADAGIDLGGTWARPVLAGRFQVHDGAMSLARAGLRLRDLAADVTFTPDSVRIDKLAMRSAGPATGTMSLTGTIRVPNYRDPRHFTFDLSDIARNFQLIDRRSVARVEISGALRLSGSIDRPALGGNVTVDRGTFYISDINQKQVVNLNDPEFYNIVDTSLVANRGLLDNLPPLLDSAIANLRMPSLDVRLGDDVWLRSAQANIKLSGTMDLAKQGNQQLQSGTLHVNRGTYRLDLGVVQRTFQVDSGSVTFFGDPNIQPELNVYASYTVRQANRALGQDVKIIAHIGGTLQRYQLDFTSNERIPLSNTEILSYLVFGQPSFGSTSDVANTSAVSTAAAALLPSVGAVLERALADEISFIDYVQVQTGNAGEQNVLTNSGATNVLSGTRIGVGKQIGERTFVTVNAGLCQLAGGGGGGSASSTASFGQSLGVTVEQRLNDGFSLQASSEPSSAALQCRAGVTDIGKRPPQYGFDLFREWSF